MFYNIGKIDKFELFDDFLKNLYIKFVKVWKYSCM